MEISDIGKEKGVLVRYCDLDANIFDDGRFFCAISSDRRWCCVGVVVDFREDFESKNPLLKVNYVYKIVEGE